MNAKFILFSIAGLGSLMMFYMWYSMNNTVKESQTTEEQYNFRISSLKSEIEAEKKLMESLRKDSKSYSQNIQEKTSLVDKLNKKGLQFDKDKAKLEKDMDTLRMDLDKLTRSSEEQKKKIESETDEILKEQNAQIDNLESEIKKLQIEKEDLMKKQIKVIKPTNIAKVDSQVDNVMQGKPPKIKQAKLEKITLDKKEDPKSPISLIPEHPNFKEEKKQGDQKSEPKNILKIDGQTISNSVSNKNKVESQGSKKAKLNEDIHVESHSDAKDQNSKPEMLKENIDFKQAPNMLPNVHAVKKDNSQLLPPGNQVKDLNELNPKDKSIIQAKPVKDENHQLKSPKNDKDVKDDVIQSGIDFKNPVKMDMKTD